MSPLPRPRARQARCRAEVALFTATAWPTPQWAASVLSKRGTEGPCVNQSERSTSTTDCMSSSDISWRPYGMKSDIRSNRFWTCFLQSRRGGSPPTSSPHFCPRNREAFRHLHAVLDSTNIVAPGMNRWQNLEIISIVIGMWRILRTDHLLMKFLTRTDADDFMFRFGINGCGNIRHLHRRNFFHVNLAPHHIFEGMPD